MLCFILGGGARLARSESESEEPRLEEDDRDEVSHDDGSVRVEHKVGDLRLWVDASVQGEEGVEDEGSEEEAVLEDGVALGLRGRGLRDLLRGFRDLGQLLNSGGMRAKEMGSSLSAIDSEEEADDMPASSNDAMRQPMKPNIAASAQATGGAAAKGADVAGAKVED